MLDSSVFNVSSLAMLLGGAIAVKGIWPIRTGDASHCRRCGYNLTGSAGVICPECGRTLNARSVVQGERKRRPGRIVAGLILLLIGGIGPGSSLIATNWYPYLPSFWLIAELSSATRGADAWQELMSRETRRGLGGRSRGRLIEVCLAARQVEYPGDCWRKKLLTQAQGERFLRKMVTPELEIRQRVRVGNDAPWGVAGRRCMPESFLYQLSKARILDNGRVVVEEQPHLAQIQRQGSGHPLLPVHCEEAGHHDVTMEATAEI